MSDDATTTPEGDEDDAGRPAGYGIPADEPRTGMSAAPPGGAEPADDDGTDEPPTPQTPATAPVSDG